MPLFRGGAAVKYSNARVSCACVTVCPTGAESSKADVPALPVTLDELTLTAKECAALGAAVIHVHIRDDEARPTLDAGRLRETVAALRERGATQLTTAELTQLLDGRYTWVRNNVTGGVFKVQWAKDGRMLIMNVDPSFPQPSEVGDISQGAYLGQSTTYTIRDDKIVTNFGNRDYELTVFRVAGGTGDLAAKGDSYIAARGNEFGYANYEVIPTPVFLGTEVADPTVPTGNAPAQR